MAEMKILRVTANPARATSDMPDQYSGWRGTRDGAAFSADYMINLALQGRIFRCSDADENDALTSVATFAATTPALLLDVPSGTICMPLYLNLRQNVGGTLASAPITVTLSVETAKIRYSSGGTAETNIISTLTSKPVTQACTVYSAPTAAAAGTACAIYHDVLAPELTPTPAEGNKWWFLDWTAEMGGPFFLVGPASFLVFAYGTNSPTFQWALGWAELPPGDVK